MFANKQKNAIRRRESSVGENSINAFLGTGSEFEGRIVFNENLRIDGTFRGEISSNDLLVVGNTANLQAEVKVGALILSGCFQGNIKARTSVELRAPAQVDGSIEAPTILIEEGVVFNGTIKMNRCLELLKIEEDTVNIAVGS
jgi:cytoskeletal protein CcmA (bactofilin family)